MKHITKVVVRAVIGFVVAASIFFLAEFVYWVTFPYQVVTIEQPIPILNDNKEVALDDQIVMLIVIDKPVNYKADVNISISCDSGNLITLTPLGRTVPAGKFYYINDLYRLPPGIAVGDVCQVNFLNFYQVNPLRIIAKHWVSEKFVIIENINNNSRAIE